MSFGALNQGALQKAWATFQLAANDEERKHFEMYACNGLDEYIKTLVSACNAHRDAHLRIRILGWFEPIYQVVQRLIPVAAIAIQAYPTPGSLVLGSIVGVLQIAERLYEYQTKAMQMLARISSKLKVLLTYENDLYEDNDFVNRALVLVFGDILTFSSRAFKFLVHKGSLHARVKGFRWMTFKDFEKQLGGIVTAFDGHMEELEARALECDKQRLKEVRVMLEVHQEDSARAHTDQSQRSDRLEELSKQIFNKQTDLDDRRNTKEKEKTRAQALNWLSPLTFTDAYVRIAESHLEGTGTWLLESPTYQSWKNGQDSKILWIRGKPGCGKSFLAARVNLDLSLTIEPGSFVVYAFLQRADQSTQTQSAILGALAKQMIIQRQKPEPMLDSGYNSESRTETASEKFIWQILEHTAAESSSTYIVIDALDEHKDGDELARSLVRMTDHFQNTRLIVFSRDDVRFEEIFRKCSHLRPDHGENEKDLRAYLDAVFDNPEDTIPLSQDARNRCVEKAQGVILWVRLFRESLKNPILRRKRLKKIGEMQPGLEAIYDELLLTLGFGEQYVREQAWLIFLLILHAERPLRVAEMLEAIVDLEDICDLAGLHEESYSSGDYLISICANLIFIDREGNVRLFHESVRNHLESQGTAPILAWRTEYNSFCEDPHRRIAGICLRYLMLKDFDHGGAKNLQHLVIRRKKASFLEYAATCWAWHYKRASNTSDLLGDLQRLVASAPRREVCLQLQLYDLVEPHNLALCIGTTNVLQILAVEGLYTEANLLVGNATELLVQANVLGRSLLVWCSAFGHQDMSLWLLNLINHFEMADMKDALMLAMLNGYTAIAQQLIEHGTDIHTRGSDGSSPLISAARYNQMAILKLLLDRNVDTVLQDDRGWTALHYAADSNNLEMIQALCTANNNIVKGRHDQTPLHIAASKNSPKSIKIMFDNQPQLNLDYADINGDTALHYAAAKDAVDAVAFLLELGCNKDVTSLKGRTALFYAAEAGCLKTVQLLVSEGVDIFSALEDGWTAIHAAASSDVGGLLQAIVQQKPADEWAGLLNLASSLGETVMHAIVRGGNLETFRFALSAGGDVSAKTTEGWTALHYAAYWDRKELIQPIINASQNPSPCNKLGSTPLHVAANWNQVEFITSLLEECNKEGLQCDINISNSFGYSPLTRALESGNVQAAELLLEKSAISTASNSGSYPIHIATSRGFVKLVEILLKHPGVNCKGRNGQMPLHFAATSGKVALIQLFANHFAEQLNAQDNDGDTPIMLAMGGGHIEATNYLLDHHADVSLVNKHSESILHIIAQHGDLSLFRRAVGMGCDVTLQDERGRTALLIAAQCSKVDLFDELVKTNPELCTRTDVLGKTCQHYAARHSLEILIRLQNMGADMKKRDLLGHTPIIEAARWGHLHIIKYLHAQGCPINNLEDGGWTILSLSAEAGFWPIVEYLLEHYTPEDVNQVQRYSDRSALTEAAIAGFDLFYTKLKEAGGNPNQRDAIGYSNEEYFKLNSPSEITGYTILNSAYQSTYRYCRMLKNITEVPVEVLYSHLSLLTMLTEGLRCTGDLNLARLCLMERRWGDEHGPLGALIFCAICRITRFFGDMYVCEDCPAETIICKPCHEKYLKDGRRGPEALEELRNIEEKMRTIRMAIPAWFRLDETVQAAYYFDTDWIDSMIKSYDLWELKQNVDKLYDTLTRPGQEFVKILSSTRDLRGARNEKWVQLCNQFERLKLDQPVGKLEPRFRCSGHNYFVVTKDERDRLVDEGVRLDSKYGRITDTVYEELRTQYSSLPNSKTEDDILALLNLPPAPTVLPQRRNQGSSVSDTKEDNVHLVDLLKQLISAPEKKVYKRRVVPILDSQAYTPDETAQNTTREDGVLAGWATGYVQDGSMSEIHIDLATTQRLRTVYLDYYPVAIPDTELWIWAVAVQMVESASPGFGESYKNERLAMMAEGDHEIRP